MVCAMLAGLIALASPTAHALTSIESCFFSAMNRERAAVGHRKLALYSDLTAIARRHSQRMAEDGTIYHNKNLGNEVGGNWYTAGENVGMGPSCKSIHDAFMSSPGHRSNILDTDYNQAGVGVAIRDDTIYVTEVFAGRRSSRPRATLPIKRASRARPAAPRPKPRPVPPAAEPRTLEVLLLMVGLDAARVNPTTGAALGV
jgi:cysteine-rich secretory family protein